MNHYHVKDIKEKLDYAKEKGLPVYPAKGPCGGCDLVIGLDLEELTKSLEKVKDQNLPVYTAEGPCGGCDIRIPI
jgi:hypothetical protein